MAGGALVLPWLSYLLSEIWEEAFNTGFEELAYMCKMDEIDPEDLMGQTYTPRLGKCSLNAPGIVNPGGLRAILLER